MQECWDITNVISVDEETFGVTQALNLHVALDAKCAKKDPWVIYKIA